VNVAGVSLGSEVTVCLGMCWREDAEKKRNDHTLREAECAFTKAPSEMKERIVSLGM
jgi:hypothetical protein